MVAAAKGRIDIAILLLARKANVEEKDKVAHIRARD